MPQAENVQRGVDVAVVNRAAFAARPFPDPKTLSTFRAAHGIAVRTGLGCEIFGYLTIHHLPRNRFVVEKVAEPGPSGIVHRFRQVRFGQFGTANIADHDQFALVDQTGRFLVKEVQASVGNLGVQVSHFARFALALEFGDTPLLVPIPARCFDPGSVRTSCQRLQAQVDTDVLCSGSRFFYGTSEGVSARRLRQERPDIAKRYWSGGLWSASYFAASCGGAPIDVLRQYIEQQETPET